MVTTGTDRTLDQGVTAANQRCIQAAAAAAVVVTLESYAADLLCPSAAAKRGVSQTDLVKYG